MILPTPILLETLGGDEIPTYVGKSLKVASEVTLVSVEQKFILGSVLIIFNASDATKFSKECSLGVSFTEKNRNAVSLIGHLHNNDKHAIGALPYFMSIPSGQALTVKGKLGEAHHDHIRGLGPGANS